LYVHEAGKPVAVDAAVAGIAVADITADADVWNDVQASSEQRVFDVSAETAQHELHLLSS
jgi:hypothetical protein